MQSNTYHALLRKQSLMRTFMPLVLILGLFVAIGAEARPLASTTTGNTNTSPKVIPAEAFQAKFGSIDSSLGFPRIVIFSHDGACKAIAGGKTTPANALPDYIQSHLDDAKASCDLTWADANVSGTAPPEGTEPGIVLLTMNVPFCRACNEYKDVLTRMAADPDHPVTLKIYAMDFGDTPVTHDGK